MNWPQKCIGDYLTESSVETSTPSAERRIRVRLNTEGIEKRPLLAETKGATRYFKRKAGQFIYGKQNLHKGAFGVIPPELDGFESSSDLPAFDIADGLQPEWLEYYLKQGNFYKSLVSIAKGAATKRIQPEALFAVELPIPPVEVQDQIIKRMNLCATEHSKLDHEITHQQTLLGKLKQAILQEAIQGKLTADWRAANPVGDLSTEASAKVEPASELLQRIQAEKARLIAEKKIRKEKPLPEITPEEIPFEIPDGWEWCRLRDFGSWLGGGTPTKDVAKYWEGDIPWITPKDMKKPFLDDSLLRVTEVGISESSAKLIPANSVLFVVRGMILSHTFPVAINTVDTTVNQDMKALIPAESGMEVYLRLALTASSCPILVLVEKSTHGTCKLKTEVFEPFLIPVPPLAEQAAIVKRVEALMATCRELEAEIERSRTHAADLLQAVLKEAFAPAS